MPLNLTDTPASELGRGIALAWVVLGARFVPKMETKEPGVTTCPLAKLAALITPPSTTTGVWA